MTTTEGGPIEPAGKRRPKRANGEGGARVRANGSWEWRLTLDDGRRVSGYGKTQAAAKRSAQAKAELIAQGVAPQEVRRKVADFLDWWLADVASARVSPKTRRTYADLIRLHIAPEIGRVEVNKLTAAQVQSLLRKKERAGLSPRTVAHIRGVLRTALNDGVRFGVVARNVAALTDPPRQAPKERRGYTVEEARRLLAAISGDRLEALYRLTLTLGLRRGEALGLRWGAIDFERGTLRVEQCLQRLEGKLVATEPKTARSRRTLTIPPAALAALRAHRDRQQFERGIAGGRWRETGYVFTTPIGTPLDPDNMTKAYKAIVRKAGLRPQRFHDLRHTAGTLMVFEGLPLTDVSAVLGHAQTTTTLNVYAHALPGSNDRAAAAMERLLG